MKKREKKRCRCVTCSPPHTKHHTPFSHQIHMGPNFHLNVCLSHGVQRTEMLYTYLFDIIREESHKFIQLFMVFSLQRLTKGSAPKLLPFAAWNFLIWNFFLLFLHSNWLLFDFQLPVSFTILFTGALCYISSFFIASKYDELLIHGLFLEEFSKKVFYFIFFFFLLKSTIPFVFGVPPFDRNI